MKNIILTLLSFGLILMTACEKDPQLLPEQEPLVITHKIGEDNQEDLDLKAEIIKHQGDAIENAGFRIQKGRFKYEFRLNPDPNDNFISKRVLSSVYRMNKSQSNQKALYGYEYSGFITTRDKKIYGNAVVFNAPDITFPRLQFKDSNTAYPNDKITLVGDNLELMADNQSIYIHGTEAAVISKSTKEIVCIVPGIDYAGKTTLEVHFGELIAILNIEILNSI